MTVGCFFTRLDVCYASCCCSFLCSLFITSQASTTTAMTTTSLFTVVYSGMSSLLSMVTMAPSLMGLPATSGQHDVVPPPLLTLRNSGGDVGPATVPQQQPPSQMPLQGQLCIGPPQVSFSLRVESPIILYLYMFGAMLGAIFTYGCSPSGVCTIATIWSLPMAGMCATW